jgi:hypothetical protein
VQRCNCCMVAFVCLHRFHKALGRSAVPSSQPAPSTLIPQLHLHGPV